MNLAFVSGISVANSIPNERVARTAGAVATLPLIGAGAILLSPSFPYSIHAASRVFGFCYPHASSEPTDWKRGSAPAGTRVASREISSKSHTRPHLRVPPLHLLFHSALQLQYNTERAFREEKFRVAFMQLPSCIYTVTTALFLFAQRYSDRETEA